MPNITIKTVETTISKKKIQLPKYFAFKNNDVDKKGNKILIETYYGIYKKEVMMIHKITNYFRKEITVKVKRDIDPNHESYTNVFLQEDFETNEQAYNEFKLANLGFITGDNLDEELIEPDDTSPSV